MILFTDRIIAPHELRHSGDHILQNSSRLHVSAKIGLDVSMSSKETSSKLNLHSIHEQPGAQFGQTCLKVQNDLVDSHDAIFSSSFLLLSFRFRMKQTFVRKGDFVVGNRDL